MDVFALTCKDEGNLATRINWTLQTFKLDELTDYYKNPRSLSEKEFKQLKTSLDKFGMIDKPIVNLDSANTIIGGHQRKHVMESTGAKEIECWIPDRELTDKEVEELNIRLNKNTGSWDFDTLANEFQLDDLLDWGFDKGELDLDLWADDAPEDVEPQIDKAEELRVKWGVESGQLWQLGEHRIVCGDCTDKAVVDRVMGGEKADICVTDPPYGVLDEKWDRLFVQSDLNNLLNNSTGLVAIFNSAKTEIIKSILSLEPTPERMGVWRHSQIAPKPGMIWSWQPVFYWRCGKAVAWDSLDWYQGNSDRDGTHPTQKPVAFFEKIIGSVDGVTVYEPFCGSGTTLIACERLGRKCRAVEISPAYVAVAIQRWVDVTGGEPVLLEVV